MLSWMLYCSNASFELSGPNLGQKEAIDHSYNNAKSRFFISNIDHNRVKHDLWLTMIRIEISPVRPDQCSRVPGNAPGVA